MACTTSARPNVVHVLLSLLLMLLLSPFILLYSRRIEKNLAKNHYKPVSDDALRVARSEFEAIGAEARQAGLTFCGSFAQAPGTGSGREELQLWLNDRRDVLLVVLASRVWLCPKRLETRVISHLGDGRTMATVGALAMLKEVSGLEDAELFTDVTVGELLLKHEWRLAKLETEPLPFDAANAIEAYEDLHWQRVQKMADLGYVTIVDPLTTQWRYTPAGEAALKCHNCITPEERQALLERDGLV
jgi:hypothetical protein